MFTILLIIGLVIGVFSLIFVLGLCRAAKRADRCLEQYDPRLLGNDPVQHAGDSATSPELANGQSAARSSL
jgi:hypothetical protein